MKKMVVLLATGLAMVSTAHAGIFGDSKVVTEKGIQTFKSFKPAAVRAEIGTLGYGGALVFSATPSVDVEAGFSAADKIKVLDDVKFDKLSDDIKSDDAKLSLEFHPKKNAYLNAKLRPFKNNFHVSTGVIYQDNKIVATAKDIKGKVDVNGNTYRGDLGDIQATYKFKNHFAPYLGIGFSPSITKRWGLFGEIGAAYIGDSDITVESNKPGDDYIKSVDENGQEVITDKKFGELRQDIQNKLDDKNLSSKVLPVAKVGVTVRF